MKTLGTTNSRDKLLYRKPLHEPKYSGVHPQLITLEPQGLLKWLIILR